MKIYFYKYQGTGNDFIIIDDRENIFPINQVLIERLCDRRFGIGADGLILLQNELGYDFKMVYFNSDGNESTMCGNGGRCIAKFSHDIGISYKYNCFLAIDGPHDFSITKDGLVKLKMKDINAIEKAGDDYIMDTGSPHYVQFLADIEKLEIVDEARKIRYNDRFKDKGINVNFVSKINDSLYLRTYERGVEDETFSCGTGTVAAAISIAEKYNLNSGKSELNTKGGKLWVYYKKNAHFYSEIWLEGSAEWVFEGSVEI